ncbi:heme NO-binding domain-containing protein [Photobacterium sp. SDRW27]|uniref:heme NO-binding domain-containing protein n=1 Tax=Photobacterium obscurum TaxID=2829490 RepID=UPI002244CD91|nr:heme NO-binding domain-containing protein [Photobacterium obscurum]MCW8329917.1 heme NO-binding domain-containing protein [Photobacterium obscurum]
MKGIIFTEFLDIVEDSFGLEVCQEMLELANDDGVYTAVGSYDHNDLVKLIISLGKVTGISTETLQEIYGEAVFPRLYRTLPKLDKFQQDTFSFIKSVEEHIHTEVKKLYPDATPPHFDFLSETKSHMLMDYKSARCMSHVCKGLIKGCAKHFHQNVQITMEPINKKQSHVRFSIDLIME